MYQRLLRRAVAHFETERPSLQEFRLGNAETVDRLAVQFEAPGASMTKRSPLPYFPSNRMVIFG